MKNYSDLICELNTEFGVFKGAETGKIKEGEFGFSIDKYAVKTAKQVSILGKDYGEYAILNFPLFLDDNNLAYNCYYKHFKVVLSGFLGKIRDKDVVMIVGLGNRHISADSFGVQVVRRVVVTRGLNSKLPSVCAFSPSVLGLTGIETADTVDAIIGKVKPTIVVYIDSLCASHSARLGRSFQISSTTITPGAGVKNIRPKPQKNGFKTISIGVPFVVYSGTFIKSELEDAGVSVKEIENNKIRKAVEQCCELKENQLVTLKDIEEVVGKAGKFVAEAINELIFGVKHL